MFTWQATHRAWPDDRDCYFGSQRMGSVVRYETDGKVWWQAFVGLDQMDDVKYPTISEAQKAVEHRVTMAAWRAERDGIEPFP